MIDEIQKNLLREVADLDSLPVGAYNIRANGEKAARETTENIDIVTKEDKNGIDIIIKPFTKNESVHIPVIISESGLKEVVYNDFHIGEGANVVIIAGCGIHNCGTQSSEHSGIHAFYIGKDVKVRYVEKHYGDGDGTGENIMNPTTVIHMDEGSYMEMETTQIKGINSTVRHTTAKLAAGATELKFTGKNVDANGNFADAAKSYDIHIEGIADDNTKPITVYLGAILDKGISLHQYRHNLLCIVCYPELERSRTLKKLTNTLWLLNTRQLNQDTV